MDDARRVGSGARELGENGGGGAAAGGAAGGGGSGVGSSGETAAEPDAKPDETRAAMRQTAVEDVCHVGGARREHRILSGEPRLQTDERHVVRSGGGAPGVHTKEEEQVEEEKVLPRSDAQHISTDWATQSPGVDKPRADGALSAASDVITAQPANINAETPLGVAPCRMKPKDFPIVATESIPDPVDDVQGTLLLVPRTLTENVDRDSTTTVNCPLSGLSCHIKHPGKRALHDVMIDDAVARDVSLGRANDAPECSRSNAPDESADCPGNLNAPRSAASTASNDVKADGSVDAPRNCPTDVPHPHKESDGESPTCLQSEIGTIYQKCDGKSERMDPATEVVSEETKMTIVSQSREEEKHSIAMRCPNQSDLHELKGSTDLIVPHEMRNVKEPSQQCDNCQNQLVKLATGICEGQLVVPVEECPQAEQHEHELTDDPNMVPKSYHIENEDFSKSQHEHHGHHGTHVLPLVHLPCCENHPDNVHFRQQHAKAVEHDHLIALEGHCPSLHDHVHGNFAVFAQSHYPGVPLHHHHDGEPRHEHPHDDSCVHVCQYSEHIHLVAHAGENEFEHENMASDTAPEGPISSAVHANVAIGEKVGCDVGVSVPSSRNGDATTSELGRNLGDMEFMTSEAAFEHEGSPCKLSPMPVLPLPGHERVHVLAVNPPVPNAFGSVVHQAGMEVGRGPTSLPTTKESANSLLTQPHSDSCPMTDSKSSSGNSCAQAASIGRTSSAVQHRAPSSISPEVHSLETSNCTISTVAQTAAAVGQPSVPSAIAPQPVTHNLSNCTPTRNAPVLPHFQSISVQKRGESISLARKAAAGARKKRELAQQKQQLRPVDMPASIFAADKQNDERIPSQVTGVVSGQNGAGNLGNIADNVVKANGAASDICVNGTYGDQDLLKESASTRANVSQTKEKRAQRVKWRPQEITALHRGVEKHGAGRWAVILREFAEDFDPVRISVDLKDKWRNLAKAPKAVRGASCGDLPSPLNGIDPLPVTSLDDGMDVAQYGPRSETKLELSVKASVESKTPTAQELQSSRPHDVKSTAVCTLGRGLDKPDGNPSCERGGAFGCNPKETRAVDVVLGTGTVEAVSSDLVPTARQLDFSPVREIRNLAAVDHLPSPERDSRGRTAVGCPSSADEQPRKFEEQLTRSVCKDDKGSEINYSGIPDAGNSLPRSTKDYEEFKRLDSDGSPLLAKHAGKEKSTGHGVPLAVLRPERGQQGNELCGEPFAVDISTTLNKQITIDATRKGNDKPTNSFCASSAGKPLCRSTAELEHLPKIDGLEFQLSIKPAVKEETTSHDSGLAASEQGKPGAAISDRSSLVRGCSSVPPSPQRKPRTPETRFIGTPDGVTTSMKDIAGTNAIVPEVSTRSMIRLDTSTEVPLASEKGNADEDSDSIEQASDERLRGKKRSRGQLEESIPAPSDLERDVSGDITPGMRGDVARHREDRRVRDAVGVHDRMPEGLAH